jgi:hypothetical protein
MNKINLTVTHLSQQFRVFYRTYIFSLLRFVKVNPKDYFLYCLFSEAVNYQNYMAWTRDEQVSMERWWSEMYRRKTSTERWWNYSDKEN